MQNIRILLALGLLALFASLGNCASDRPRIVGGRPTNITRLPYLVNLRRNGAYICSGTLVSRRHVVTAAHCVKNVPRKSLTVVAGTSLLTRVGVRRDVSKVFINARFLMSNFQKDVAVLKLKKSLPVGSNIKPIRLCNRKWRAGMYVRVSGWGLTNESAKGVPVRVRTVRVPLISKRRCVRQYRGRANLTTSMFCAGVPGERDACQGDSGGPLVYRNRLCGVTSFGIGCARENFPGVYTNIRQVRKFIRKAMSL